MPFTSLLNYASKSASYSLLASDSVVQFNCSTGSFVATLPDATVVQVGRPYEVRRAADATPANTLTVNTVSSQTIDTRASGSIKLQPSDYLVAVSDGTNWQVVILQETVGMRYFNSASSVSGSASPVVFSNKSFDTHSAYSGSTFTAPAPGKYLVICFLSVVGTFSNGGGGFGNLDIFKNGSQFSEFFNYSISTADLLLAISDEIPCAAGDTLQIQLSANGSGMSIQALNRSYLIIQKVGN